VGPVGPVGTVAALLTLLPTITEDEVTKGAVVTAVDGVTKAAVVTERVEVLLEVRPVVPVTVVPVAAVEAVFTVEPEELLAAFKIQCC